MSLFSDPFFRRGTTLLAGEAIENNDSGQPMAGSEVVGQVKVFQDVNPTTGKRNSNRLVWCVAARYKGATVIEDASTVAGEVYAFDDAKPLTEFTNKASASTSSTKAWGVLDEYLTGQLRPNDIVWVVMKGPTSAKRTAVVIAAGSNVSFSSTAGQVLVTTSGTPVAQQIGDGGNDVASVGLTRINLPSSYI